ncbi:MAG: hypothetical protein JW870_02540, partial [Candidatus Delongbacteria bacterium]|nr:hypothetical protein [Candidatus Delongbacteria bacterium]
MFALERLTVSRKILFTVILSKIVMAILIISFIMTKSSDLELESALSEARLMSKINSMTIQLEFDKVASITGVLSGEFSDLSKLQESERKVFVSDQLKRTLEVNKDFFGVWAVFEENALGSDKEFNQIEGMDENNRFVPYWNRLGGAIKVENCTDYDNNNENGFYYQNSKKTKKMTITNPVTYEVSGQKVEMISIVSPIIRNNIFIGAVGIDISMDGLKDLAKNVKVFDKGFIVIISNNGSIVYHKNENNIGKKVQDYYDREEKEYGISNHIKKGDEFEYHAVSNSTGLEMIYIYQPIKIGNSDMPWAINVQFPEDEIFLDLNEIKKYAILIGIIVLMFSIIVVYFVSNSITKSIDILKSETSKAIDEILNGNLKIEADSSRVSFEFKPLIDGVNGIIGSFVKPIEVTNLYLSDISKGNLPEKIKEEYKGDFNKIKNSINSVIDVINGIQSKILRVCEDAKKENFSSRADFGVMQGEWKKMLIGVNELMAISEGFLNSVNENMKNVKKEAKKADKIAHYQKNEVERFSEVLNGIASGDLTIDYKPLDYDEDTRKVYDMFILISKSLGDTLVSLNNVLSEVKNAANEIEMGSAQLSDASQALSSGSTEQASS